MPTGWLDSGIVPADLALESTGGIQIAVLASPSCLAIMAM